MCTKWRPGASCALSDTKAASLSLIFSTRSSLPIGMLSKIKMENGNTPPSLATIQALSHAMSAPMTALFWRFDKVQHAQTKVGTCYRDRPAWDQSQVPVQFAGPYRFENIRHSRGTPSDFTLHEAGIFATFQSEGIELIYMLEGAVGHLHLMQIYPLKAGDALFFDVNAPHGPEILVRFPARYL
jgi:hypothetical protein